jgi:hypothetical protein
MASMARSSMSWTHPAAGALARERERGCRTEVGLTGRPGSYCACRHAIIAILRQGSPHARACTHNRDCRESLAEARFAPQERTNSRRLGRSALCHSRPYALQQKMTIRSPRRRRAASMARRGRGPVSCQCPVQGLAAGLRLPGHLAALAAWAVIVAHHTTLAPMGKLTSIFVVAEAPNVFEIADAI